jgi:hypothetical protein
MHVSPDASSTGSLRLVSNGAKNAVRVAVPFVFSLLTNKFLRMQGCGDIGDIAKNGGTQAPEGDCNMPCSGDSSHICVSGICPSWLYY